MNQANLHHFFQKFSANGPAGIRVRKVGPVGAFLLFILFALVAVVGIAGLAVFAVGAIATSIVRGLLPRSLPRAPKPEPTITVLDASGKTITTVPRS